MINQRKIYTSRNDKFVIFLREGFGNKFVRSANPFKKNYLRLIMQGDSLFNIRRYYANSSIMKWLVSPVFGQIFKISEDVKKKTSLEKKWKHF